VVAQNAFRHWRIGRRKHNMIDKFFCPCCNEERPLPDGIDTLFPGLDIECPECGTVWQVGDFVILREAE